MEEGSRGKDLRLDGGVKCMNGKVEWGEGKSVFDGRRLRNGGRNTDEWNSKEEERKGKWEREMGRNGWRERKEEIIRMEERVERWEKME